jgi:hypothetical protein
MQGSGDIVSFKNAESSYSLGLELEARLTGSTFTPKLEPFYMGANVSLIRSRVRDPGIERPLQGQSPYVVNTELGWRRWSSQISVLYNVFGERIEEVGLGGYGNVLEQPFHRVDVVWNQRLGRGFNLKAASTNLLNRRIVFEQNGVEILAFKPGVSFSVSLEWSLENGKDEK